MAASSVLEIVFALGVAATLAGGLVRFYDPVHRTWTQGSPGAHTVFSSTFARLHLARTTVVGSGPTGPTVQVTWRVVFRRAAVGDHYRQYLNITDDHGGTTHLHPIGTWSVTA